MTLWAVQYENVGREEVHQVLKEIDFKQFFFIVITSCIHSSDCKENLVCIGKPGKCDTMGEKGDYCADDKHCR